MCLHKQVLTALHLQELRATRAIVNILVFFSDYNFVKTSGFTFYCYLCRIIFSLIFSIRLTPSYAYLIFFYTYLLSTMSEGPAWGFERVKVCKQYWWTNLLYINNFYPKDILNMVRNSFISSSYAEIIREMLSKPFYDAVTDNQELLKL